jgi:hypothetical protein
MAASSGLRSKNPLNNVKDDIMTTQYSNWMAVTPHIGKLRIDELILPGTHNSGMDKQSPNISLKQEITQDVPPLEQIKNGIRVLDLRVSLYDQYPVSDPRRFQIFHSSSSGRTISTDILGAVEGFLRSLEASATPAKEIIILDFHQFKNFNDAGHHQLISLVLTSLGKRLIPYSLRHLKLEQLWQLHPDKNVVIAYNSGISDGQFWDGVDQRWSGVNLISTSKLKTFMDGVANTRKPDYRLQSIQCAKYVLPFHMPDDFSKRINEWFESTSAASYIQQFHIINTDWSLRSNIVRNCIHANIIKAGLR